jgi:DNA processing protein
LISEYSPHVLPAKHHFPARNRLISGLARAVVVVQAPLRSGALITADFALQEGREVLVHAAGLGGAAGAGGRGLEETGSRVVRDARGVLDVLRIGDPAPVSAPPDLDEGPAWEMERQIEEMDAP